MLGYAGRAKPPSTRTVSPLGLVTKSGVWYLVAATGDGVRTFRVGRVTDVAVTEVPAVRPQGFDLATAWQESAAAVETRRGQVTVQAVVEPAIVSRLRSLLGVRLRMGAARPDGRVEVEVTGPAVAFVAAELSRFGSRLEVTGPAEARRHLAELAGELRRLYGAAEPG